MSRTPLLIAAGCAGLATSAFAVPSGILNANGRNIDVQTPASGNFIDLAGLQAILTQRADLTRAAVLTGENADGSLTTLAAETADAVFSITGPNRYSRNDAAVALAATSGGRFGLIDGTNTFNLSSKVPEGITHFGVIAYNYLANGSASLLRATATFSDGTTEVYDATASAMQYSFVGFRSPAGTSIVSVKVDEVAGGGWMGFDDLTVVVAEEQVISGSTWTGTAGNGQWGTAGNWDVAPTAGTQLIFNDSVDISITNNLAAGIRYNGLFFPADSTGYEILGNAISPGPQILHQSFSLQSLLLPLVLQENLALEIAGPLELSGAVSGDFSISKSGAGQLIIEGTNTYTGGTALNRGDLLLGGNQSGASGGWSIGITALQASRLMIEDGASVVVAEDKEFRIGSTGSGTAVQTVDVAGTVTNAGLLHVGRPAFLNLEETGVWNQSGPMTVLAIGGYDANLTVKAGGAFNYSGTDSVKVNAATGNSGKAYLTINGGVFTTSAGFERTTVPTTGFSRISLSNDGKISLSGNVPVLATGVDLLIGSGEGVIDTGSFNAGLNAAVTGAGTLVKAGSGTLAIDSEASISPVMLVIRQGTVSFPTPTLSGISQIDIATGGTLLLDYVGTGTLSALFINGVEQANGVWGAPGSGAQHESPRISGAGLLQVSADVSLASIVLSVGTITPAINPEISTYTAVVNHTTSSITITPTATEPSVTLTVNGASVPSGASSEPVDLAVGENTVTIVSTSANGAVQQTHTILVTRLDKPALQWDLAANRIVRADFEASGLDVLPNPPFVDQNAQGLRFVRDDALATPFGAENRFVQVGNANVRFRTNVPAALWNGLTTVAFDLYEPAGIGNTPVIFGLGGLSSGNPDINDVGALFAFSLNNGVITRNAQTLLESGALPTLEQDQPYRVAFLLNRTANIVDYADPEDPENTFYPLAPGRMVMWVKHLETDEWSQAATFTTTNPLAPQQWIFRTFSTGNSQIYFDNFVVRNTLTVGEPKSPPLWNGGGGADILWTTAANWVSDPPMSGAPLAFGLAPTPDSQNDLAAGTIFGGMEFNADADSLILSGNAIGLSGGIVNGSLAAQTLELNLAIDSTLQVATPTGAIYLDGVISGTGALEKTGVGPAAIFGKNTYTGGTIVQAGQFDVAGDQSAANGGWSVGPTSAVASLVTFADTSIVKIAVGKEFRIGNTLPAGPANQQVNFSGILTNNGSLLVGRAGILSVSSGGEWTQGGAMKIEAQGGFGARAEVFADGVFHYAGETDILLNGAHGNSGTALLNVDGGILSTGVGFAQTTVPTTGYGRVTLSNGGTLRATAAISELASGVQIQFGSGGGVIDTQANDVSVSVSPGGSGGLTKEGTGKLSLLVAPMFAGETVVSAGTLMLGVSGLSDDAGVSVAAGAKLGLDFDGSDTVSSLTLNDVLQGPGVYSAATHPAFFSGAGSLVIPSADPFAAWISLFTTLADPADLEKGADPDGDGMSNIEEFAFNSDPSSGVSSGKISSGVRRIGEIDYLVLTIPVRDGAVFTIEDGLVSQVIDGISYAVRGGADVTASTSVVFEVTPTAVSGLPALDSGWSYRSFRLEAGVSSQPKGFLRAEVVPAL